MTPNRPLSQMTVTTRARLTGAVAAGLLLTPLGRSARAQDDPIGVVASFSVLADIVANVGGEHATVRSLVPVGGDAHTFDPAPDQVMDIADAALIVQVGDDFEPWLADLVNASGTDATVTAPFEAAGSEAESTPDDEHGEDGHEHGDEVHRWLDVHTTIDAVAHLAIAFAETDPDHADAYAANAETYTAALEELDRYIIDQTATLPEDRRLLVTSHQTFSAFAERYGFEIPGVLLESGSTEGADAPAGHVAELAGIIDELGIPAVFPDTPGGEEQMAPLADAAGVEVAPRLYVDTLGEDGSGAETYIDMMRYNIDTIVAALGG
jgi:ABC-type Zn uptake system ZnuABC Zn-binding protein ZnuA